MYYLSKKEYRKDKFAILVLGLIIGFSFGICIGFHWGIETIESMIRTGATHAPQAMRAIPF